MMSCNTPYIDQTNEAVGLSFFSMDIQFSSRLSLICGAWDGSWPVMVVELAHIFD